MKLGDEGDYSVILDLLRQLKKRLRQSLFPSSVRDVVVLLRTILSGLYQRMEAHAIKRLPGIATMLFTNLSGQADLTILNKVDKACREYGSAAPGVAAGPSRRGTAAGRPYGGNRFSPSAYSRGGARGARGGRSVPPTDESRITCFHCFERGHRRSGCPQLPKPEEQK